MGPTPKCGFDKHFDSGGFGRNPPAASMIVSIERVKRVSSTIASQPRQCPRLFTPHGGFLERES